MKSKSFISFILIILVISVSLFARIFSLGETNDIVLADVLMPELAEISGNGVQFSLIWENGFSDTAVYTFLLACICVIFGNFTISSVYLNILLQVLSVVLLYCAINKIINKYVACILSIIFSVIPPFMSLIFLIDVLNLWILIGLLTLFLVSEIFYIFKNNKEIDEENVHDNELKETAQFSDVVQAQNNDSANNVQDNAVIKVSDIVSDDNNVISNNMESVKDVVPAGMKEIKSEDLVSKKHKMIENPLPLPKKKIHKKMDYAINDKSENDDFDLKDISENDDFDLK